MTNPNTNPVKNVKTAYLWWFFLGATGAHRFYLGKKKSGVLFLLTLGLCGVGVIVDAFTLARQVREYNAAAAEEAGQ